MYLLDANVFIEAKNRYYGFDICPGFWEWLDREHARGSVYSVDRVAEELLDAGDELSEWVEHEDEGSSFIQMRTS